MKLPEWYWSERRDLVKRLHQMELEPDEVSAKLAGGITGKGGDFLSAVVHEWVSRDVEAARRRLASAEVRKRHRELERTADRKVAEQTTGWVEAPLDADLFPGNDHTTTLEEDKKWLNGYKERTERYVERHKYLRSVYDRLIGAVGGDETATRAQAKQALRHLEKTRRALGE